VFEILALLVLVIWFFLSVWIAATATRLVGNRALKVFLFVLLAPGLVALPFIDEIIGKFQFDRLCAKAEKVNYFGAIQVGQELYTTDGKWRLGSSPRLSFEEFRRVRASYEALVRWESTQVARTTEWIPISESDTRIYNRVNGALLASFRSYGTPGGWISRKFEKPAIVRDQCLPHDFSVAMEEKILPFRGTNK
jgi:hypothetical protein